MTNRPIQLGTKRQILAHTLGVAGIGLRLFRRGQNALGGRKSPNVLLLEPYGMGDVISLEPLARVLTGAGIPVVFSGKTSFQPLIPPAHYAQWIPSYIPWSAYDDGKKYERSAFKNPAWGEYLRALHTVCRGAIGIDSRGDIRSVLLLLGAGCREVWSLTHYLGSNLRLTPGAARRVPGDTPLRRWEMNLQFARALGVTSPEPPRPPDLTHLLPSPLPARPGQGQTIGLIPGAPYPGRLWAKEKWQELAARLRAAGWNLRGFYGPGGRAQALEMLGNGVELVEANSIPGWAAQLAGLGGVISLDSGPLHLANALGLRVIGLFGPGKLPMWEPSGPGSFAVHHQDRPGFAPIHQIGANIARAREYMEWITVDDVLQKVALWSQPG